MALTNGGARRTSKRLSSSSAASNTSSTSAPNGSGEHRIKVLCRVRPFLPHENKDDTIAVNGNSLEISNVRSRAEAYRFSFDACYDALVTQEQLFKRDVQPLIDNVFKGLSTTVFCYGVTGAGKTHTIQGSDREPGIIPRTMRSLFGTKKRSREPMTIRISYMEIYREIVFDLLIPRDTNPASGLAIREDANRNIFVANLTERAVESYPEFERLFKQGRSTASTKLNGNSSRSHAILMVQVEKKEKGKRLCGRVHLIDLAGSEDNRRTENGRDRMAESGAINRSLFVLGQVVEALNTGADSLGGKSMGMMIVNVAPGHEFYQDTINTLNFAKKSKTIVNKTVVNEIHDRPPAQRLAQFGLGKATRTTTSTSAERRAGKRQRTSDAADSSKSDTKRPAPSFSEIRAHEQKKNPNMSKEELEGYVNKILEQKLKEMQGAAVHQERARKGGNDGNDGGPQRKKSRTSADSHSRGEASAAATAEIATFLSPSTKTKSAKAYIIRAKQLEKSGELEKALAVYQQALGFVPDHKSLQNRIDTLRAALDDPDVAMNAKNGAGANTTSATTTQPVGMLHTKRTMPIAGTKNKENHPPLSLGGTGSLMKSFQNALEQDRAKTHKTPPSAAPMPVFSLAASPSETERRTQLETHLIAVFNSMDLRAMKKLKNIGAKRAQQIVAYVDTNGPMQSLHELSRAGISANVLENIIKLNS
ncbi:P-loop containing nucleoside triphosphate hydrolase protein [Thamnocephalis sphaerospora]|uniref:Kinesin-like protein n=1 Tax=Thamnocephalis sphaerospora TaxID=78915 RepID=A0A4V1IWE8_9FUNG|nr:P-loop containing nucleoside triphosphate hydrolase protein [Thamnocephalis sphaerospora]|eukprot:RKP07309.1 P-loop containing nucleoside triphosphate hydrolase protein [Thamnocephalis sphaerospora]